MTKHHRLVTEIRDCRVCSKVLPHSPNPIISFSSHSQILIIGQAPGIKVHNSGIPWDDASGDRLRKWLGVEKNNFYNTQLFGIVPMGFCYPGKGRSGDLPPRSECAATWMDKVLKATKNVKLTILVGSYAQKYHLGELRKENLTATVRNWQEYLPKYFTLPHPSPRNNIWLSQNTWFESETLPALKSIIEGIIKCRLKAPSSEALARE